MRTLVGREPILQSTQFDCGLASLLMIAQHYGSTTTLEEFEATNGVIVHPWSARDILAHAKHFNLIGLGIELDPLELKAVDLPCILHWRFEHFVVLREIRFQSYWIDDPAIGRLKVSRSELLDAFTGIALTFSPDPISQEQANHLLPGSSKTVSVNLGTIAPAQVIGALISAALAICSPLIIKFILDEVISSGDISVLRTAISALIITALMAAVLDWVQEHKLLQGTQTFHRRSHHQILSRYLGPIGNILPGSSPDDERQHATLSDLPMLCQFYNRDATLAVTSVLVILGYLALLSRIDGVSALILLGSCITLALSSWRIRDVIQKAERLEHLEKQQFSGNLNDLIQHQQLIRHFRSSFDCIKGNDLRLERLHNAMRSLRAQHWQSTLGAQVLNQICHGGLLYWICSQVFADALSIGSFYLILIFRAQLVTHSLTLNHFIRETLSREQSMRRLQQATDKNPLSITPVEHPQKVSAVAVDEQSSSTNGRLPNQGTVRFQTLEDHQSFFEVAQTIALEDVQTRHRPSIETSILDLDRVIPVGIVPIQTPIFNGSITANITLFAPSPSLMHLQRIIDLAGLNSGVRRHPLGLNTRISSQHHRFDATMQLQLGLARALYAEPQALIIELNKTMYNKRVFQESLRRLLEHNLSIVLLSRDTITPFSEL